MIKEKNYILNACDVIKSYLEKRSDMTSKRKILLKNLLDLTLSKIKESDSFPIKFSTQELYTEQYLSTQSISEWYDSISTQLNDEKDIIIQLARTNNCQYYFKIDKYKRPGKTTLYSITAVQVPEERYILSEGGIKYEPDKIHLPFFIRWFDGFTIVGWRKWLFALVILFVVLIIIVSLVLINPIYYQSLYHWFQGSFFFAFIAGWVYWLFRPFRMAIDHRIVEAPSVFLPFDITYGQLESTRDDEHNRFFRIIVYKAECPICGSRIDVRNGGKEYPLRMIGCCRLSPSEHIFSFDPETLIGFPLRAETAQIWETQK